MHSIFKTSIILYKQILFIAVALFVLFTPAPSLSETKNAPETAPKDTQPIAAESDDIKYPKIYVKCTREASANEEQYEQLFVKCMGKNGYPQEDYKAYGRMQEKMNISE